jgi:catechol 2,3-dioxygenase-like lactoylglutathione lyase family enzyme
MLTHIHPKLPIRHQATTQAFYTQKLGFEAVGGDFESYLMLKKEGIEIHFFEHKHLDTAQNYGQVYIRTTDIHTYYNTLLNYKVDIHPQGQLAVKSWGQKEFSVLDPDNNLLTFGQNVA